MTEQEMLDCVLFDEFRHYCQQHGIALSYAGMARELSESERQAIREFVAYIPKGGSLRPWESSVVAETRGAIRSKADPEPHPDTLAALLARNPAAREELRAVLHAAFWQLCLDQECSTLSPCATCRDLANEVLAGLAAGDGGR